MTSAARVAAFIDVLNARKIPYMITGPLASNLYGIPRSTQDADFVVQLQPGSLEDIAIHLGSAFTLDPQASFESVTMTTRHVFRATDHELKIELFGLSDDPHDQERFRRRRQGDLEGRPVSVPTAEDVVIAKLRWIHHARRSKDIQDAENVLAVQGDQLDWEYIRHWCRQHETLDLLEELRRGVPPE